MAAAAATGGGPAGPQVAGAAPPPVPGPGAVLIGDRLYSGVLITLENCLLPEHTLRFTPSMSSGLDPDTETELRVTGCELIQAAGILLRLPQVGLGGGEEGTKTQRGFSLCRPRFFSVTGRAGPAVTGRTGRGAARLFGDRSEARPGYSGIDLGSFRGFFGFSRVPEAGDVSAFPAPPPCEDRGLCKGGFLNAPGDLGGVFCFPENFRPNKPRCSLSVKLSSCRVLTYSNVCK